MNLHDDDERWFQNVAVVREVWNQRGRILGTEKIYRRHWRGKDADPQYGWTQEREQSRQFDTLHDAQEWTNAAWNALHVARAQRLTADQMLQLAEVTGLYEQTEMFRQIWAAR